MIMVGPEQNSKLSGTRMKPTIEDYLVEKLADTLHNYTFGKFTDKEPMTDEDVPDKPFWTRIGNDSKIAEVYKAIDCPVRVESFEEYCERKENE